MTETPQPLTIVDGQPVYPWLDERRPEGGLIMTDGGSVLPPADPNLSVDYTPAASPGAVSGGWVNPPPYVLPVETPPA